jgi:formylglycine-generating enzyme required for sulfatase activity
MSLAKRTRLAILIGLVALATASRARCDDRLHAPKAADEKGATEKVRGIFSQEIAAATDPKRQVALAKSFAEHAEATAEVPAKWALMRQAELLAIEAGDAPLLVELIEQRAKIFRVDALGEKAELLQTLTAQAAPLKSGNNAAKLAIATSVVDELTKIVESALAAEKFDVAADAARLAISTARRVRDGSLSKQSQALVKDVTLLRKQSQAAARAIEKLKSNPDDPSANEQVGRYRVSLGDWLGGAIHLSKSSDESIAAAAKIDMTNPTDAASQVKAADGWLAASQSAEGREKAALLRRALYWYGAASSALAGLEKIRVDKQFEEATAALAAIDSQSAGADGSGMLTIPLARGVTMQFRLMPAGTLPARAGQAAVAMRKPFYMQVTETTQAQWLAVTGVNPSQHVGDLNRPVEFVNMEDIAKFIEALNRGTGGRFAFRLPTAQEWEYSYRAGTTSDYFFGADASKSGEYAWTKENAGGTTHPVAKLKPNPAGLYDMTGNVWEWCDGAFIAGGCFVDGGAACNATWVRPGKNGDVRTKHIGFRLAVDP